METGSGVICQLLLLHMSLSTVLGVEHDLRPQEFRNERIKKEARLL